MRRKDTCCFALVLLCVLFLVAMSAPASADRECALSGVFKSDSAMTLADIVAGEKVSPAAMNALSDNLFGHMTHQWKCGRLRAWFDFDEPGQWQEYEVVKHEATSIHITFLESGDPDIHLLFEGTCYKIRFEGQMYYEYFCPSDVKSAS